MEYILSLLDFQTEAKDQAAKHFEELNKLYKGSGLQFDGYGNPVYCEFDI